MAEVTKRRPIPVYLYKPEDHSPLDSEGLVWLADQLCSEERVHPERTMSVGWLPYQAAYEYPALFDALAAKDAEIEQRDKERHRLIDRIDERDAEIEALRAEVERLKSKNRTAIKAAFFDGWDAARKGGRSDAWEHSRTRQRIDYPSAALKDPQP